MSHFDPNDPAAEIKYLKALERAKKPTWPAMPDDPAKAKKGEAWPAIDGGKKPKKPPRHVRATWGAAELPSRAFAPEGIPPATVARVLLLLGMALAAALLID